MANGLTNPSLEVNDVTMYSAVGSANIARAASGAAPDGAFVGQFTAGASGNATLNTLVPPVANPGEVWSGGIKARLLAGTARSIRVDLQWLDSGSAVLSSSLGTSVAIDPTTFTQYKVEGATAPASTAFVRIRVVYLSAVAVDAYEVDCFQLEQGATLPAYNPVTSLVPTALTLESALGSILLEDGTMMFAE